MRSRAPVLAVAAVEDGEVETAREPRRIAGISVRTFAIFRMFPPHEHVRHPVVAESCRT
jgi:hypothetical protein